MVNGQDLRAGDLITVQIPCQIAQIFDGNKIRCVWIDAGFEMRQAVVAVKLGVNEHITKVGA